jgi:hypothetical protein
MSVLRSIVKKLLPVRVRQTLRGWERELTFRRAMRRFLEDPDACTDPANPLLMELVRGWGNESWSGLSEFLAGCIARSLKAQGPTLECGSGLSTILVGAVAKKRGYQHWALENAPEWVARVSSVLSRYKLDSSVVLHATPLKDYGDFCWYDAPLAAMPDRFSVVVCDGPPGTTKGGRYGLVPIMKERLGRDCVIILDDAARADESAIARRWQVELGSSYSVLGDRKPYAELVVGRQPQRPQPQAPQ